MHGNLAWDSPGYADQYHSQLESRHHRYYEINYGNHTSSYTMYIFIFIAIRDHKDEKTVHLFDDKGKALNDGKNFQHRMEIAEVALDQVGLSSQRKLAFIDKNRDLFLTSLAFRSNTKNIQQAPGKLGSMVISVAWNTEANMLAALQDTRLTVYLYPSVIFVDKGLLGRTMIERDASEFGKRPTLVNFVGKWLS